MIRSFYPAMIAASTLLISQSAMAGWGAGQEKIAGHDTWVFVPESGDGSGKLLDGKRALIINLHGCAQSASELKGFGNWDPTAKAYGLYVAIPDVGTANSHSFGCWDYRDGADLHHNASDLVRLAGEMKSRFPDIDPNQVYITGLSSGGAMALLAGCKAPDVFAGVGAIAGPSVGSNQDAAFSNPPPGNVDHALAKCKELAGAETGAFGTQITSVGYGDLDKNGGGTMPVPPPQGVRAIVPVEWTKDNAQVLARLYQPCSFGGTRRLPDGKAEETLCTSSDGKQRVSLLKLFKVGHAWPAGSGDTSRGGGDFINKVETNYPAYVTDWFFANNPRAGRNHPPELSVGNGTVSGTTVTVVGSAEDSDPGDRVTEVSVKLAGRFPQPAQTASGIKPWSTTFPGVTNDACYTPEAVAKDTKGAVTTAVGAPVRVGNPPSGLPLSLTVSASLEEGACIDVMGTVKASECASVQKVEVALGNRGFEPAKLMGQDYTYHECGLPGGTYSTTVKATDSDGHDTLASGPTIVIDPAVPLTAQFFEHVVARRIRMYALPCSNTSFGTCDADIPAIISKHPSGPFSLYHVGTSDVWYLDEDNAKPPELVINVNSASVEELDELDGIGKTRAVAIIGGRPYSGTEELVSKHILSKNVYDAIKDKITIGQR